MLTLYAIGRISILIHVRNNNDKFYTRYKNFIYVQRCVT